MNIAIVHPNQLFELKYLPYNYKIIDCFIITEDPIYFCDTERELHFNLLKLIYQRASMKFYHDYLSKTNKVIYLEWNQNPAYVFNFIKTKFGNVNLHIIDPIDHLLRSRIDKFSKNVKFYNTPAFLSTNEDLKQYVSTLKKPIKRFYQYNFYIWQRHRLDILLENNKPIGGKYSYDKYNRKALPKNGIGKIPQDKYNNKYYDEAVIYCEKTFKNYYKSNYKPENIHFYPINHEDAKKHFKLFLKHKLRYFGDYEDAVNFDYTYIYHSVISPQLNNGLLNPKWVLENLLTYYENSSNKKKILPAVEGFVRQLNWREYSRLLYINAYDKMRRNYFNHQKHLTKDWYNGTTGIEPIDLAIKTAFQYGYIHHIIRLMIMCNFMNLCQINPNDAYAWFMEFSLDSYDWVMINNVYSMGLFADGGYTTTKPYISSSNYLKKMTTVKPDGKWDKTWTTLYYYFISENYDKLRGRGMMYQSQWRKVENKKEIIREGKKIIAKLTS